MIRAYRVYTGGDGNSHVVRGSSADDPFQGKAGSFIHYD